MLSARTRWRCGWRTTLRSTRSPGCRFSSRHVAECLRRGADAFRLEQATLWRRNPCAARTARSIGWGVAIGAYPGMIVPAIAHLEVTDDGGVFISIGGHEMGQGIRTALANAVSRKLGVPAKM